MSPLPRSDPPQKLPPGAPGGRLYMWLFTLTAFVAVLVTLLGNGSRLPETALEACRAFRLCAPPPPTDMPSFQSDYVVGNGAVAAAAGKLTEYRRANPDYVVDFVPDPAKEKGSCDDAVFKVDCRYSYGGTWTAEPKWRGLFERIGW